MQSPSDLIRARKTLRATLRAKRRALSPAERAQAADRVARHVQNHFPLYPGKRIALYSPLPDELDVAPLIRVLREHRCAIYLPRLTDERRFRMRFFAAEGPMRANRLGILEPQARAWVDARWLHLVFVPMVGFDAFGMRLGMGAGYYDRAFAWRFARKVWRGPRMVGLAYAFQQVPRIDAAPHDVRLDAVVTDEGVLQCNTGC
jgi:5-formyltetrahydrofolate cyclo-ligase